jgi:manganese transport protein
MLFPLLAAIALLLGWISLEPWLTRLAQRRAVAAGEIHPLVRQPVIAEPIAQPLRKVALALDFSGNDVGLIETALAFLAPAKPPLALLHVVESASARAFGRKAADLESDNDQSELTAFAESLRRLGYQVETALGAGDPAPELARLANELEADLVILGGHGHRGLMDMIYGTTVEGLRHRTRAKVLVIPSAPAQRSF